MTADKTNRMPENRHTTERRLCGWHARYAPVIALSVLLGGCGTANYVKQNTAGGQIQIGGSYMHSMRRAKTMMVNHCEGQYEVTSYDERGSLEYVCVDDRISSAGEL